ncbi:unnamed protein product [Cylicostephanus goldi]|uniref:Uncharacterized protein n=1 Tax=Cylicostephanus goldi TaxID=71465 RepID=A0A3P6RBA1_CYLGO|nr:unnamed protein product [Cylicostephanus goldi]
MRVTQRHGRYKGEDRLYWTYRCVGCQSYRSLVSAQNQPPSYGMPRILAGSNNIRGVLKQEQKPFSLKRPGQEEVPSAEAPAEKSKESGFVIYIPRALSPEDVKIVRLAFFKILTDQYDEERDLPALKQLRAQHSNLSS